MEKSKSNITGWQKQLIYGIIHVWNATRDKLAYDKQKIYYSLKSANMNWKLQMM